MEVELKVEVKDFEALKQKLISMDAEFFPEKKQTDSVYRPKERKQDEHFILRVRELDDKNLLTYKAMTDQDGAWIEHQTEISDAEAMKKIISSSRFELVYTMTKIRSLGRLDEFELCLDHVEEVGDYLEVSLDSDDKDAAKRIIIEFLKKIGFNEKDIIHKGYGALLFQKRGLACPEGIN